MSKKGKKMTENEVMTTQNYIADGFVAYKKLAKYLLKSRWKNMTLHEQCNAARALVVMGIVAKEPDCFSRKKSEYAWRERVAEYAKKYKLEQQWYGYYFVEGPKEIVWNQSTAAMIYPLSHQYYHFLDAVQNYEYAMNDWEKERYAKEIKSKSEPIINSVDIIESKPIVKQWKQLKRHFGLMR